MKDGPKESEPHGSKNIALHNFGTEHNCKVLGSPSNLGIYAIKQRQIGALSFRLFHTIDPPRTVLSGALFPQVILDESQSKKEYGI